MIVRLIVTGITVDVDVVDAWNFRELKLIVRAPAEVSLDPVTLAGLVDEPSPRWTEELQGMLARAREHGWIDEVGGVRVHVEVETASV